jgi:hypothetical protein
MAPLHIIWPIALFGILAGMVIPAHAQMECSSYRGPCNGGQMNQLLTGPTVTGPTYYTPRKNPLSERPNMTMADVNVEGNAILPREACNSCNWVLGFYSDDNSGGGTTTAATTATNVREANNWADPSGVAQDTASPCYANGKSTSSAYDFLANPMIMHDLHNMTAAGGPDITIPSFTNLISQGYYVYPDLGGVTPSFKDIVSITPSPSTGNITTGSTITFTLTMDEPTTVSGTPTLSLNSGGTSTYASGSGTKSLVFNYVVGAGDSATTLRVTAVNAGPVAPAPAAAVGFNENTYSSNAFATSNVDMTGTFASGFQWYLFNFFGSTPTAANITINGDKSITIGQGGNTYNATLSSAGYLSGSPNFVGTAFGGGAYIQAVIKFNPPAYAGPGFPAFWANALESNLGTSQWPGQAAGYGHSIEADILEYYEGQFSAPLNQYSASLIDWYGSSGNKYGVGTVYTVPQASFSNYNTVAMLWVPATATADGYVNYYWNGSLVSSKSYTQLTNADQPPPSVGTPWAFGIIDQGHLVIETGSNSTYPITIQSVNVWQPNANSNMHN